MTTAAPVPGSSSTPAPRGFVPAAEGVPERFKAIEEYLAQMQQGGGAPAPAPTAAPGPLPSMAGLEAVTAGMHTSGAGYQISSPAALNPALGTRTPPQSMQALSKMGRAY